MILVLFGMAAVRSRSKVPGRLQITVEMMMEYLRDTFMSALGPGGERHLPLIFGLFFYILFCNLLELIPVLPGGDGQPEHDHRPGDHCLLSTRSMSASSPKASGEYLKHFLGPLLVLAPLFIVIEILGEFVKPFSLGMRLFGNIYAEDIMNDLAAGRGSDSILFPFQIIVYSAANLYGRHPGVHLRPADLRLYRPDGGNAS